MKNRTKQEEEFAFFAMSYLATSTIIYTCLILFSLLPHSPIQGDSSSFSFISLLSGGIVTLLYFPFVKVTLSNLFKQGAWFMMVVGISSAMVGFALFFSFQITFLSFVAFLIVSDLSFIVADGFFTNLKRYEKELKEETR